MTLLKSFAVLLAGVALLPAHAEDVGRIDTSAAKQLTVDLKTCPKPVWPKESLRREETGRVTLEFLIGLDGKVLESTVLKSSGFPLLDLAAQDGLAKCQFTPPSTVGRSEPTRTRMQYVWTLEGKKKTREEQMSEWQRNLAAAEQGEAVAQWRAGLGYLIGFPGVERNNDEGLRWLRASAEQNHLPAMEALAFQLMTGSYQGRDPEKAVALLEKAVAQGSSNAQLGLAMAYIQGQGVARDEARGEQLLEKAIASGSKEARTHLAARLLKQGGENAAKGISMLEDAAHAQDRMAQFMLAEVLEKASCYRKDKARSLALYERVAASGFLPARDAVKRLKDQQSAVN